MTARDSADLLTQRIREGDEARENGRLAVAERAYREAVELSERSKDQSGIARAHSRLAITLAAAHRFDDALQSMQTAISCLSELGEPQSLAYVSVGYAQILIASRQPFQALAAYAEAQARLESIGENDLARQLAQEMEVIQGSLPIDVRDEDRLEFDRLNRRMEEAVENATRAYRMGDPAGAASYWSIAVESAHSLGFQNKAAEFLSNLGLAKAAVGRLREGASDLAHAASLAHTLGLADVEGTAANNLGCVALRLGDVAKAIEVLERALELRSSLGDGEPLAECLANLGVAYTRGDRPADALRCLKRAGPLYLAAGNSHAASTAEQWSGCLERGEPLPDEVGSPDSNEPAPIESESDFQRLWMQAENHNAGGKFSEAAIDYEHLLRSRFSVGEAVRAQVLIAFGYCTKRLGRPSDALRIYQYAIHQARLAGDVALEARALNNAGAIHAATDVHTAVEFLRQAAELRESLPDRHELGETYVSLASCTSGAEATDYLRRAMQELRAESNPSAWAAAYRGLVKTLSEPELSEFCSTHADVARSIGLRAIPNRETQNASWEEVNKLHALIPLSDRKGVGLLIEAPSEKYRDSEFEWRSLRTRASVEWRLGQRSDAIETMLDVIRQIEGARTAYGGDEEREQYLSDRWDVYDELIDWLVHESRMEEALEITERVKSRSLLDSLALVAYVPRSVPEGIAEAYRNAAMRWRQREDDARVRLRASFDASQDQIHAALTDAMAAQADVASAVEAVRKHAPDFDPQLPLKPMGREAFRALLETSDHLVVVWWLGRRQCGAFTLSSTGVTYVPLPSREALDQAIARYRAEMLSYQLDSLAPLSHALIDPLVGQLRQSRWRRVTVVPHHYLHLVPFHSLSLENDFLLDRAEVDYAPSLTLFGHCLERASTSKIQVSQGPLIVGNPDGELPAARIEAVQLGRLCLSSSVLVGRDATVKVVLADLRDRRHVHFACHGDAGEDQLDDFHLDLASSPDHSGRLSARQIVSQARLAPRSMVVLSACNSGRTVLGSTDEYTGLVGAFLLAGAGTVIASLWPVDDAATALLMHRLYQDLTAGVPAGKALRSAQAWLRSLTAPQAFGVVEQWLGEATSLDEKIEYGKLASEVAQRGPRPFASPIHWAAFVCVGNALASGSVEAAGSASDG